MQPVSSQSETLQSLEWQLQHLPHQPGAYLMKDKHGTVLYVGKAVVLANRVKSYFQKRKEISPKTDAMVAQIASIETIVTGSELEALLLENNLIKKYRPKYNVILRDDKNYPLLRLPVSDDYPRLEIVRRVKKDGALYFGPYIPSNGLYEMLRLLRRLFPLPNCTIKIDGAAERPCIEFEIKRCLAPCTGNQSKEAYHEMIQNVRMFLEGKDKALLKTLQEEMAKKAVELNFEEAARIRDQIAKIKRTLERQRITLADREDQDVLALLRPPLKTPLPLGEGREREGREGEPEKAMIVLLFIRNGMVLGKKEFFLNGDLSNEEIVSNFLQQFYDKDRIIPKKVILPIPLPEQALLQQWLSEKSGHAVALSSPSRGAGKQLIDLAMENAKSAFAGRHQTDNKEAVLTELQSLLHLSQFPSRIEGYDISNIMGTSAVGSMVVFEGGVPKNSDYRHFKIKTIDQANDFGMMAEVLRRRIALLQSSTALTEVESVAESFHPPRPTGAVRPEWPMPPNLILIDGGKGQISAVREVLESAGFGSIDFIGLAKERENRPERVFLPDIAEPIALPVGSPVTHLLMRVRDEAHRFAISYHRKVRSKKMLDSPLEEIAGIGKIRRLALLRHFGSIDKIREASLEAIQKAPGFSGKIAQQLFDTLHNVH